MRTSTDKETIRGAVYMTEAEARAQGMRRMTTAITLPRHRAIFEGIVRDLVAAKIPHGCVETMWGSGRRVVTVWRKGIVTGKGGAQ